MQNRKYNRIITVIFMENIEFNFELVHVKFKFLVRYIHVRGTEEEQTRILKTC